MKKTIRLFCYGPIAASPKAEVGWEDVWITYEVKRKIKKEGPTLLTYPDIIFDIKMNKELYDENKEEDYASDFLDELNDLTDAKNKLDNGDQFTVIRNICDGKGMPLIVTKREWINKRHAEEMIEWYLRQMGILKSEPRFKWNKPDIYITPVSFR